MIKLRKKELFDPVIALLELKLKLKPYCFDQCHQSNTGNISTGGESFGNATEISGYCSTGQSLGWESIDD